VTDHGLLYGDGVFEGIRIFGRRVFRSPPPGAARALRRAIGLALPLIEAGCARWCSPRLRAFGRDDAYVRLIVTRGEGALGVDPTTCPSRASSASWTESALFPAEKLARGLDLVTVSWRRPASTCSTRA
jgi:branched-chain amino acid aminotransferase